MKNIIKTMFDNISDQLFVFSVAFTVIAASIAFAVIDDQAQISNTQGFINEVNEYQNVDHKAYCEKAVSREASEAHLKEEGCL